LMFQAEGKADDARRMIQSALEASAPRGFFRIFLDEGLILRPLLESTGRFLKAPDLAAYVKRLLDAMPEVSAKVTAAPKGAETLSERELDVLRLLAAGESYKEIGQKLFLSLNTVQFHVKSIYRKLGVNQTRGQQTDGGNRKSAGAEVDISPRTANFSLRCRDKLKFVLPTYFNEQEPHIPVVLFFGLSPKMCRKVHFASRDAINQRRDRS